MNNDRIVVIRKIGGKFSESDPWRNGAKNLVEKTILSGSNLSADDLEIPAEVNLVLSTDQYNIGVENTYSTPIEKITNNLLGTSTLSEAVVAGTGISSYISGGNTKFNPWFSKIKTWDSTRVSVTALQFDFAMGAFGLWNAKKEVFAPMLSLLALTLPSKQNMLTANGPFLATSSLLLEYAQQISSSYVESVTSDSSGTTGTLERLSSDFMDALQQSNSGYYNVSIGDKFTFQYCIFSASNISFSTDVDDNGFPIKGSISLSMEGTVPAAADSSASTLNALRFG